MVFAIHQHESARGIHVSLPILNPLPSPFPPYPSKLLKYSFIYIDYAPLRCITSQCILKLIPVHRNIFIHFLWLYSTPSGASQVALVVKNLPANAGDLRDPGSIPGSGRSPGEGNGYPLQYSCLENPMDRVTWWAVIHRVAKNQT